MNIEITKARIKIMEEIYKKRLTERGANVIINTSNKESRGNKNEKEV